MKLSDFASAQWWLTVGVASIMFSLCIDLVKKGLYAALGLGNRHWRERSEKSRADFQKLVSRVATHPMLYAHVERSESRHMLNAIYVAMLGLSALGVTGLLLLFGFLSPAIPANQRPNELVILFVIVGSSAVLVMSSNEYRRALRWRDVLAKADQRIKARDALELDVDHSRA